MKIKEFAHALFFISRFNIIIEMLKLRLEEYYNKYKNAKKVCWKNHLFVEIHIFLIHETINIETYIF